MNPSVQISQLFYTVKLISMWTSRFPFRETRSFFDTLLSLTWFSHWSFLLSKIDRVLWMNLLKLNRKRQNHKIQSKFVQYTFYKIANKFAGWLHHCVLDKLSITWWAEGTYIKQKQSHKLVIWNNLQKQLIKLCCFMSMLYVSFI